MVRKLFDPSALQSPLNVLTIDSLLEDIIKRKKRRMENSAPPNNLIAQDMQSKPPSQKAKK